MTALSSDRKTVYREGVEIAYPVAAQTTIYAGSLVCLNTSGYAVPGADTAGFKFAGVARETAKNGTAANGAAKVLLRRRGVFRFASSAMAVTDVEEAVYIADDQTVAKTSTNSVACGRIAEFISATEVGVDIEMR
ncbi:MAG: DUF2190 family protein [Desulfobacteraceae bacterium]|nr:DUF2190 family protein [Desulfobacteraceae bacterium]